MITRQTSRRALLGSLTAVAGTAAAASAGARSLTGETAPDARQRPGYRESDHVRTFYRVNSYPGARHADQTR